VAVLLLNTGFVPRDGGYINDELEIVVAGVSFLYGPIIGDPVVIYKNGILYDMQEAYDKGLLARENLKSIAYYQNEGFILPQRTPKIPLEEKIIWGGDISQGFDDKTLLILMDKNYTSWRFFANDFLGVNVKYVRSLGVKRLLNSQYPLTNDDFNDILEIGIGNPGKQNVINAIKNLEKLDFIKYAGPNYIMYLASF
jgi:hypothetical protein